MIIINFKIYDLENFDFPIPPLLDLGVPVGVRLLLRVRWSCGGGGGGGRANSFGGVRGGVGGATNGFGSEYL